MTSVERIKSICKERHIPIMRLEQACGFSNGYFRKLKRGTLPDDRLFAVAEYLGLSPEYLSSGEEAEGYYLNAETAQIAQEIFDNPDLHFLFNAARNASPEDLKTIQTMLEALQAKENGGD